MSKRTSSGRTGSSVLHHYGGLRASTLAALCAACLPSAAAWAVEEYPPNGHIAFERKVSGSRGIWYMKADGSGMVKLADDATWPTWRPDGTKIAFNRNNETYVMDHDGSGETKLSSHRLIQWLGMGELLCRNDTGDCYKVTYPGGVGTLLARRDDFSHMVGEIFNPGGLTWDGRWLLAHTRLYGGGYTGSNGYFEVIRHAAVMLDMNDKSKVYFIGEGCEPTAPLSGNYIYHVRGPGTEPPFPSIYRIDKGDTSRSSYTAEVSYEDADWGHEYFPRVSTDNVWLTYAASTGCHDYETCTYHVFIHRLGGGNDNRKRLTTDEINGWPHMFVGTLPGTDTVSIDSFTADPSTITGGESSTLSWQTSHATKVSVDNGVGSDLAEDGSKSVSPAATTTYTLTAEGTGGPVTAQVTVNVIETVSVPFRMNCGENSYTPSGWAEDDAYVSGGADYNWSNPVSTAGVRDAAPDDVYKTVRYESPHTYTIPIVNGSYVVRLHLCEAHSDTAARDVKYVIDGQTAADHLDYATEAGGHYRALVMDFNVTVADGDVVIECSGYSSDVFEAGIEILDGGGTSNQPPTVSITAPADGASFAAPADIAVTADAGDTDGSVSKVDLYLDGAFVQTESSAPYEWTLTGLAAGSYALTARATDDDGATATSAAVTITVADWPTITLVQPNGGEVWYVGTTPHIEWTTVRVGDVAISYWSGANGTWEEIAPSVLDTDPGWGDYPWTVPDAPATDCRVSISDYNMVADAAQSAAAFEIRSVTDSDSDGIDDGWETQHFGDLSHDGTADTDGDGLTDYGEFVQGTDPLVSDSVADDSGGTGLSCAPVGRRRGSGSCVSATVSLLALVLARRKRPV